MTLIEASPARRGQLDGGITLVEGGRTTRVRVPVLATIGEALADRRCDVAVVAVKSYHTRIVADQLASAGPPPVIASFQNGVGNDEILAAALPACRLIAASLTTGLELTQSGEIHGRRGGGIGLAAARPDPLTEDLALAFQRGGLAVRRYSDAAAMKWSKLLLNLLGSATSALLGWPPGQVFADRRLFDLERRGWLEALAVMRAMGLAPCRLVGYPVPMLATAMKRAPSAIAFRLLGPMMAGGRGGRLPSVAADIAAGRAETENGVLTGAVVRYGDRSGVAVPISRALATMVDDLVAGRLDRQELAGRPEQLLAAVGQRVREPGEGP